MSEFKVRPLRRLTETPAPASGDAAAGARPVNPPADSRPAAAPPADARQPSSPAEPRRAQPPADPRAAAPGKRTRMRELVEELRRLEAKLRRGGGPEKVERQHQQGKLTARERIELLLDRGSHAQEIGLLVAYDQYKGGAPSAGVVTTVGRVGGREVVVVANDATVKAGSCGRRRSKRFCARRRSPCARASPSSTSWIRRA